MSKHKPSVVGDILAIMASLNTFTSDEISDALEMSIQGANRVLRELEQLSYIERVRVGKSYMYGVTMRGMKRAQQALNVDCNERVMLLVLENEV